MLRGLLGGYARGRRQTSAATLYLDFLAGLNDSRITYSGGTNGTRVNSAGVIVAATTPRFDYNPVTLAARGLLVEEARTNLMTYSQDFANAAWAKSSAAVAVTGDATTSPDGTTNADKIYEADTTTTDREVFQVSGAVVASATMTGSVYVKQAERTTCQVRITSGNGTFSIYFANINLATGAITGSGTAGGMVSGSASIQAAANGFYRVIITGVFAADVTLAGVNVYCYNGTTTNYAGVVNSGFYVWGAQFEAGSFATSYIPTTTAAVTKTSDVGAMTGSNFTAFYNQSAGTVSVQFDVLTTVAGTRPIVSFDNNTANERIELYASGTDLRMRVIDGGATQVDMSIGTIAANTSYKAAIAWAANDFAGCLNGGTVATDTSGTLPTPDRMRIGSNQAGDYLNGHEATLEYLPRRSANTQLQAMTA